MTHTTEIVKFTKLSNGQFEYVIRCCGDVSTDHPHVLGIDVADRTASLKVARDYCAAQHAKSQEITEEAVRLAGDVQEHA